MEVDGVAAGDSPRSRMHSGRRREMKSSPVRTCGNSSTEFLAASPAASRIRSSRRRSGMSQRFFVSRRLKTVR
jgi:hypothetical protein